MAQNLTVTRAAEDVENTQEHLRLLENGNNNPEVFLDNQIPQSCDGVELNTVKMNNESSPDKTVDDTNNVPANVNEDLRSVEKEVIVLARGIAHHKNEKKKEKVPSVATSIAWKEYYTRKQNEKDKVAAEKEERKRSNNEILGIQKKRKLSTDTSNDSQIMETQVEEEQEEASPDERDKTDLVLNDYVIIMYDDEYFPGVVKQLETDRAFVTVICYAVKWSG
ncbi:hypothetical protein FQR65_LT16126 [Abscondita terminalis]|nr:hypothetical protein FQR65_LT16126 [Abscondita terminalis]